MVTPSLQPRKGHCPVSLPFILTVVGGAVACLILAIAFVSTSDEETLALSSSSLADTSNGNGAHLRNNLAVALPTLSPTLAAERSSFSPTVRPDTGAFKECQRPVSEPRFFFPELHDHSIVVSCRKIHYKLPRPLNQNRFYIVLADSPLTKLLVGILSSASGKKRREAIRQTWASKDNGIFYNRYFVVGGTDFKAVEYEFYQYRDMIWLDMEESYDDLMYKTGAMLGIFQKHVQSFEYVLKTDDDTYNNIPELYKELSEGNEGNLQEYFGHCHVNRTIPYRPFQKERLPPYFRKFIVNKTVYPEKWNAPYCQGRDTLLDPDFYLALEARLPVFDIILLKMWRLVWWPNGAGFKLCDIQTRTSTNGTFKLVMQI